MAELADMLSTHLKDPEAGWSMGTFGAIAEFHQVPGEALVVDAPDLFCRATERGGVWIDPARISDIVPVAYEALKSESAPLEPRGRSVPARRRCTAGGAGAPDRTWP